MPHQLHSGGTSLLSSSSDFSERYSFWMRKEKKAKLHERTCSWWPRLQSQALADVPGWRPRWRRWARPANKEALQAWAQQLQRAKGWVAEEVPPTMAMLTASSYSFVMTLTKAEASNRRMRGFLNWKKKNCNIKLNVEMLKVSWSCISSEGIKHTVLLQGPSLLMTAALPCPDRLGAQPVVRLMPDPAPVQETDGIRDQQDKARTKKREFPLFSPACTSKAHLCRHTVQGWP